MFTKRPNILSLGNYLGLSPVWTLPLVRKFESAWSTSIAAAAAAAATATTTTAVFFVIILKHWNTELELRLKVKYRKNWQVIWMSSFTQANYQYVFLHRYHP
jgi:hypothetical protein